MDKTSKEMLIYLDKYVFDKLLSKNISGVIRKKVNYTKNCYHKKEITPQEIVNRFYTNLVKDNGRNFGNELNKKLLPNFEKIEKEFRKKFLCIKIEF